MRTKRTGASTVTGIAVVALVVAIVAIALPYLSGSMGTSSTKTTTTQSASPQTREFYLVTEELAFNSSAAGIPHYVFSPTQMTVNQGDTVLIHFYDTTDGPHTFTLPGYSINVSISPGQEKNVTFTASTPGVFLFNCNLHPTTMRGQLTVLPTA